MHLSARRFLEEELQKQNRPIDRDQMYALSNTLRGTYGSDYIIRTLYEQALQQHQPVVIESIRAIGEIDLLRQKGNFILIGVDAPLHTRFERILERGASTDKISFEKFVMQENAEMESTDPSHQNLKKCIEMADYVIVNDGTMEDLYKKIEEVLEQAGM